MSDHPNPPKEDGASTPVSKEEGCLNSSMITIIVDDTHFRLGSHFLSESETLKAIISTSETDSIRLQNVTAAEVRALWRFFNEGMYDDYKPSTAEWIDLISIANTYGLKRVHRRAVAEIGDIDVDIDPIKRVLLAKQLNIKKWLAPATATIPTVNLNLTIGREVIDLLRGNLNVPDGLANPGLGTYQDPVAPNPAVPRYDLQCPTLLQADRLPGPDMAISEFCRQNQLGNEMENRFHNHRYYKARLLRFITLDDVLRMGLGLGEIAMLRDAIERWSVAR